MKQIAHWLHQLDMQEYTHRFAENDIDFEILPDLSDNDLEKIGITSLGHRRKLLRAIANLKGPERRQVTVMFSDLVGSTALAARMDLEDLRDLISDYHKR